MIQSKTKKLVTTALLAAVIVVLQTVAAGIKIGPFTPTLSLIPIVIGAIVCGPLYGGFLGLVFGVIVIIGVLTGAEAMSTMMMQMHPFMTVAVCTVKGVAAGILPGLVYNAIYEKNETVGAACAALLAPIMNTGIFCLALITVFLPVCQAFAEVLGFTSAGKFILAGIIGTNFLFELGLNAVLIPVVIRVLRSIKL